MSVYGQITELFTPFNLFWEFRHNVYVFGSACLLGSDKDRFKTVSVRRNSMGEGQTDISGQIYGKTTTNSVTTTQKYTVTNAKYLTYELSVFENQYFYYSMEFQQM